MEKFFSLPVEKQNVIIDAALRTFGTNGYKKASISDIAVAAGISKAMVFHYFGTKKALYLYLINLCGNIMMNEVNEKFDNSITDFFDRIKMSSDIEISVMKRHAAIPSFLANVYFENDEEVKADIQNIFDSGDDFRNKIAFEGVDTSKFKEGVDLKLLMKMLMWMAEGYTKQMSNKTEINFDAMMKEFNECMDMLRNNFYKEEYL
ncbi:helix-turn-helix transcriptional regulator [Clostridiaceae bacterium UIB06]|uniref:Helix-turn-helix transcriptional regulator n=1 Tax=Clostridium thailandense TaxID=2794346 RepID=A0A949TXH0_9CLOT|nr:TetR/AcrR family transcriptional regulator [Clostridium thailandense]MBV7273661.1 helix-turn-helix transcriptional regulator [Clostridium thailandense]MCH5137053.1 helix-turn-helix transcriptional regulator [Clostridiaceae bacterium UIB06]